MESEKRPIILIAEDDESNYLLLFVLIKRIKASSYFHHLIAEDDESNYLLLFALLKRDYQIIHAHDGIEAIQLFKNFPLDAILMDIKMPHMDGLTAMQAIREIDQDISIIVVSAYVYEQDKQTAYSCGCNAYIMKPVDAKKLTSTISLLLSIKEPPSSIH